jgi:hypothetical protein
LPAIFSTVSSPFPAMRRNADTVIEPSGNANAAATSNLSGVVGVTASGTGTLILIDTRLRTLTVDLGDRATMTGLVQGLIPLVRLGGGSTMESYTSRFRQARSFGTARFFTAENGLALLSIREVASMFSLHAQCAIKLNALA